MRPYQMRLDPRTKFSCLLWSAIVTFAVGHPVGPLFGVLAVLIALAISPVRFAGIVRQFAKVFWFIIIIIIVHTFGTSGRVFVVWGGLYGTLEGFENGMILSLRIVALGLLSFIFVATTPVADILDATETTLGRLSPGARRIVPVLQIALNFVPTMILQARKIRQAQIARGASPGDGVLAQLRFARSAALPLFVGAFGSADRLAVAMESRGFIAGAPRTIFRQRTLRGRDWVVMGAVLVAGAGAAFLQTVYPSEPVIRDGKIVSAQPSPHHGGARMFRRCDTIVP